MKIFVQVIFILSLIGCTNPFSTRTPDSPDLTTRALQNLQSEPDSLLAKIRYAFLQKNSTFYADCLADSSLVETNFNFVPQKNDSYRLAGWDRQDEINYFNNLVNNNSLESIAVNFFDMAAWTTSQSSADTMQTQFSYKIDLKFRTKTENYQGRTILKILRSQLTQLYYIYFWEDFELEGEASDSTWSTLKANYRYN